MNVQDARIWAEGAQLALKQPDQPIDPAVVPTMLEALAVLGRQEHGMRSQLNATKQRLQDATKVRREQDARIAALSAELAALRG